MQLQPSVGTRMRYSCFFALVVCVSVRLWYVYLSSHLLTDFLLTSAMVLGISHFWIVNGQILVQRTLVIKTLFVTKDFAVKSNLLL